jgi:hypothetical protein
MSQAETLVGPCHIVVSWALRSKSEEVQQDVSRHQSDLSQQVSSRVFTGYVSQTLKLVSLTLLVTPAIIHSGSR